MLKLMGACLIMCGSTAWGFFEANKLRRRAVKLEQIIFFLKLLENEIAYGKRDIKNLLSQIGENRGLEFLIYAAENIDDMGIREALYEATDKYENDILGTDKTILKALWDNLGMTDSDSQTRTIRHIAKNLEDARAEAEAEYMKNGRARRHMGCLGGAFAVILLL